MVRAGAPHLLEVCAQPDSLGWRQLAAMPPLQRRGALADLVGHGRRGAQVLHGAVQQPQPLLLEAAAAQLPEDLVRARARARVEG